MLWSKDDELIKLAYVTLEESLSYAEYKFLRGFSSDGKSFFPPQYHRWTKNLGKKAFERCKTYDEERKKIKVLEGYNQYRRMIQDRNYSKSLNKKQKHKNKSYAQEK